MAINYLRPPITEAVIELKYADPIDAAAVERISRRFGQDYPVSEDQQGIEVQIDTKSKEVKQVPQWAGKKLSSNDQANIIALRDNLFVCIRLAPYTGWDEFFGRARAGWKEVVAVSGVRRISRVGVRYINRLDIPISAPAETLDIKDYLAVWPNLPSTGAPIATYAFQATRAINSDGCSVTIASGTVPSPLVDHISLTLDVDVFAEQTNLIRDNEIWDLVSRMRDLKNNIFEASITDRSRELFK